MLDFWLYFQLGLTHVLDWKAYDHVLFLAVLCAAYSFNSWRRVLILVSLFTLGHTASLILASYNVITVSGNFIEFLIPITIMITAIFNIFTDGKEKKLEKLGVLYFVTLFFGLIHGMGFASFFNSINEGKEILPLLEFALGIEAAQLIVVISVLLISLIFQSIFRFKKRDWVLVISSIVIGLAMDMLAENWLF